MPGHIPGLLKLLTTFTLDNATILILLVLLHAESANIPCCFFDDVVVGAIDVHDWFPTRTLCNSLLQTNELSSLDLLGLLFGFLLLPFLFLLGVLIVVIIRDVGGGLVE